MSNFIYLVHTDTSTEPYEMEENAVYCSLDYNKALEFAKSYLKKNNKGGWFKPQDIITKIPLDKQCKIYLTSYTE